MLTLGTQSSLRSMTHEPLVNRQSAQQEGKAWIVFMQATKALPNKCPARHDNLRDAPKQLEQRGDRPREASQPLLEGLTTIQGRSRFGAAAEEARLTLRCSRPWKGTARSGCSSLLKASLILEVRRQGQACHQCIVVGRNTKRQEP